MNGKICQYTEIYNTLPLGTCRHCHENNYRLVEGYCLYCADLYEVGHYNCALCAKKIVVLLGTPICRDCVGSLPEEAGEFYTYAGRVWTDKPAEEAEWHEFRYFTIDGRRGCYNWIN